MTHWKLPVMLILIYSLSGYWLFTSVARIYNINRQLTCKKMYMKLINYCVTHSWESGRETSSVRVAYLFQSFLVTWSTQCKIISNSFLIKKRYQCWIDNCLTMFKMDLIWSSSTLGGGLGDECIDKIFFRKMEARFLINLILYIILISDLLN